MMQIKDEMKSKAIVAIVLLGLLIFGLFRGDFAETWQNGATL